MRWETFLNYQMTPCFYMCLYVDIFRPSEKATQGSMDCIISSGETLDFKCRVCLFTFTVTKFPIVGKSGKFLKSVHLQEECLIEILWPFVPGLFDRRCHFSFRFPHFWQILLFQPIILKLHPSTKLDPFRCKIFCQDFYLHQQLLGKESCELITENFHDMQNTICKHISK